MKTKLKMKPRRTRAVFLEPPLLPFRLASSLLSAVVYAGASSHRLRALYFFRVWASVPDTLLIKRNMM